MRAGGPVLEQESFGALLGKLVEDGRDVATAEIALYKAIATERVSRSVSALPFLGVALLLAIASTVMLLIGLAHALELMMPPGLAALASGLIGFVIAGICGKLAATRLGRAFAA